MLSAGDHGGLDTMLACPGLVSLEDSMKSYALVGMRHRGTLKLVNSLPEGQILDLVREPGNRYDPMAVQVWALGTHLGYVAANQVRPLAAEMDRRQTMTLRATGPAHMPATLHWSRDRFPLVQVMDGS
jgi:hypothetical protein